MVELKAKINLDDRELAQDMNYCEAFNLPVGVLLNFGSRSLQYKRVYNVKHPDNAEYRKNNPKSKESDDSNT